MATSFSDLMKDHALSFICIQETKKRTFSASYLRKMDAFNLFSWNWIPSVGKSGGLISGV